MVFSQMSTLPAKMLHGERKEELKLGYNRQPVRASQDLIKKARVIVTFREGSLLDSSSSSILYNAKLPTHQVGI